MGQGGGTSTREQRWAHVPSEDICTLSRDLRGIRSLRLEQHWDVNV